MLGLLGFFFIFIQILFAFGLYASNSKIKRLEVKEKEYEKLPVRNIEQIYAIIDVNIPDEYEFNSNTVIHIFDSIKETSSKIYDLSEENISNINSIHSLGRGTFINQLFNQ